MSGILTAFIGSGGAGMTLVSQLGTNVDNSLIAYYYNGYSFVGYDTNTSNAKWYPDWDPGVNSLPIGTLSSAQVGGVNVYSVYSIGVGSGNTTLANYYVVVVAGDTTANTTLVTNITVNGTLIPISARAAPVYTTPPNQTKNGLGTGFPSTRYVLTPTTVTTSVIVAGGTYSIALS